MTILQHREVYKVVSVILVLTFAEFAVSISTLLHNEL